MLVPLVNWNHFATHCHICAVSATSLTVRFTGLLSVSLPWLLVNLLHLSALMCSPYFSQPDPTPCPVTLMLCRCLFVRFTCCILMLSLLFPIHLNCRLRLPGPRCISSVLLWGLDIVSFCFGLLDFPIYFFSVYVGTFSSHESAQCMSVCLFSFLFN